VRVDPKTAREAWPLPEGSGYTNLNTAISDRTACTGLPPERHTAASIRPAASEVIRRAERPRPLRHPRDPQGVVYYASLPARTSAHRRGERAATLIERRRAAGRAARVVGLEGQPLGGGVETRATSAATSR